MCVLTVIFGSTLSAIYLIATIISCKLVKFGFFAIYILYD